MALHSLLATLGDEIQDPEEETFLLFSQEIPSQNLGFVDSHASALDLTIAGKDYVIHQSRGVLTSNRAGGTTGAVLWKVTPLFAEWIASPSNPLCLSGCLNASSSVIELGCGISGLIGLVLSQTISRYVLTDQSYVAKLVESNLEANVSSNSLTSSRHRRKGKAHQISTNRNLMFAPLDWEVDEVTPYLTGSEEAQSFDIVIACDCIYNEALIRPLVQTCVDVCKLRVLDAEAQAARGPSLCIVAQQLRDPEIFEGWMKEFDRHFRAWRVPETALSDALRENVGFVIHIGILREQDKRPRDS